MSVATLVERSRAQRAALVAAATPLVRATATADRVLAVARRLPLLLTVYALLRRR